VRNVIVTGGSRGLGLGIAQKLSSQGFRVMVLARRDSEALAAARAAATPGEIHFQPFDLEDIDSIAGLVKSLRTQFGPFYGLVNNAGLGTGGLLSAMPNHEIDRLIRLNVTAPITITKYVVRSMMAAGGMAGGAENGGRIVNISSVVAATGYSGLSVYSATKSSLVGFTKALGRELGPLGITVNSVAPGFIATDMTHGLTTQQRIAIDRRSALKRMAEVSDIAGAVGFLFSEDGRNITATVMTVDAGGTA
jgi:3-oxoacyl-[acyl-carrier protein] reductase